MLTKNDRSDLKWAMQAALIEQSRLVTESRQVSNYILQEATYEQMLNLCFNPKHKTSYRDAEVLENVAISCILEAAGHGEPSVKTTKDKYELLESVLHEADDAKVGALKTAKKWIGQKAWSTNKRRNATVGAGILAASAAGAATLYYLYRKLRKAGKDQSEAAAEVAKQADNQEEKQEWQAKAAKWRKQGK